ncbi:beta-galactosidase [Chryseobacterium piperi]|uniref:glycoside hydrolase family 2 protein n=1 Tax=Chryseobacterium piperi TaxID=558152 RepID=UPI000BAAE79C|nr:glycoside hydrolase family 2 TIM barrel-domain containing protein [Chryseobacterium piperi]ASW73601.1 beta-galactosidase [Chryseobacterium piperi]
MIRKITLGIFACFTMLKGMYVFSQSRQVIPLNSDWKFHKTDIQKVKKISDTIGSPVTIPHTWNNEDMQLGKDFYQGNAIYEKQFKADPAWKDKRVFIRFEGVGNVAKVLVNNQLVGEHKGAYSAFSFDISSWLRFGELNTLKVMANNEADPEVIPVNHKLFGIYGGIYRPVSLIITNRLNISVDNYAGPGVYISQKNVSQARADLSICTELNNKTGQPQEAVLLANIYDQAGKVIQSSELPVTVTAQGLQRFCHNIQLQNPHLWNGLEDPYLHKVTVQLKQQGTLVDEVSQPLGIRHIEINKKTGLSLNNKKIKLHGVTRHQDWWGFGSALSNKQHAADLEDIRDIGANSIRLAHYQQAEYVYAKSDSIGFLVWAEIPFVNATSGKEKDNALQQMKELIRQNFNHPSIYVWGMHNEVYEKNAGGYVSQVTAALHDLAKTEDPGRYTVSVNGYGTMERPENGEGDLQGMNRYYGWYEGETEDLEQWMKKLEQNYPDNKIILSEYGADGNIFQQTETIPAKFDPVNGTFFPEQRETRMHEIQWGAISKSSYLVGSYLWNMFDFAVPLWSRGGIPARNMKGLITFDRKTKKDVFYWYKANWSAQPVLYISDRRLINRKEAVTNITVYSNIGIPDLKVNGKKIPAPEKGTTDVHYIFKNVSLKKGKNKINVLIKKEGKTYTDEVYWNLN